MKYGPGGGTNPLLFSKLTKRGQRRDWSPFFLGEFMPGVGGWGGGGWKSFFSREI